MTSAVVDSFVKLHRYFILKIMCTTAGMSPSILFLVAGVNSTHFLRVKLLGLADMCIP
jgi:hypothetical protein